MSKDKETSVVDRQAAIKNVEVLQAKYGLATLQAVGTLERALLVAEGIQKLRQGILPLMPSIMPLMNNPLGFDTDKNPAKTPNVQPYPAEQVVDCVVEAMLRGLRLSGNEFNIIAGKCYTTQQGYKRLVLELPGISDLDTALSPPFPQGGQTCVKVRAVWKLNGKQMGLKGPNNEPFTLFAIRVNNNQGIDATLGKAERRMYKAIYNLCTGTEFTEPNVDESIPELPAPEGTGGTLSSELYDRLADNRGITKEQIDTIERLKPKLKPNDLAAVLMRRGKNTPQSLSATEAADVIAELLPLADDGGEPPA